MNNTINNNNNNNNINNNNINNNINNNNNNNNNCIINNNINNNNIDNNNFNQNITTTTTTTTTTTSTTNNNIDLNYNLYKTIFRNKYLAKIIFKFVKRISIQFSNSINQKSFNRICKYENATFGWCIKNNHIQLIYDKIRIGTKFKSEDLIYDNIMIFIKQLKIDQLGDEENIINKFFNQNKTILINLPQFPLDPYIFKINNILTASIYSQNIYFVKAAFNGIGLDFTSEPIKKRFDLLELSTKLGNLKIIDYLYQTVGLKFNLKTNNINKLLINAFSSENRENVVQYLLEKTDNFYHYDNQDDRINRPKHSLFPNSLPSFKLLKPLYQRFEYQIEYNFDEHVIHSRILAKQLITDYNEDTYNGLLNFLENSFFVFSKEFPYLENGLVPNIKKRNHNQLKSDLGDLIKQQNAKEILLLQIKNQTEQQENKELHTSIINDTSTSTTTTTTTNTTSTSTNTMSKNLNMIQTLYSKLSSNDNSKKLINFDIKRKLYKFFVFKFLKLLNLFKYSFEKKRKFEIIPYKLKLLIICDYSCRYNKYQFINKCLKKKGSIIGRKAVKLLVIVIGTAIKYLDSKILDYIPDYFEILSYSLIYVRQVLSITLSEIQHTRTHSKFNIFNSNQLISTQINFIKSFYKLYDIRSLEIIDKKDTLILEYFFKININNINNGNADKIAEIINDHLGPKSFSSENFLSNFKLFKYFFENHNQLFRWNSINIQTKVIETNDLELIQYFIQNKLDVCIEKKQLLSYAKTRKVAEFFYDQLGCRYLDFNDSIISSSLVDDWDSNYLFSFCISKVNLELDNVSDESFYLDLGKSYRSNFDHWEIIKHSGLLNRTPFFKANPYLSVFFRDSLFNDLENVLCTLNRNYLKRFYLQFIKSDKYNGRISISSLWLCKMRNYNDNHQFDFLLKNQFCLYK